MYIDRPYTKDLLALLENYAVPWELLPWKYPAPHSRSIKSIARAELGGETLVLVIYKYSNGDHYFYVERNGVTRRAQRFEFLEDLLQWVEDYAASAHPMQYMLARFEQEDKKRTSGARANPKKRFVQWGPGTGPTVELGYIPNHSQAVYGLARPSRKNPYRLIGIGLANMTYFATLAKTRTREESKDWAEEDARGRWPLMFLAYVLENE